MLDVDRRTGLKPRATAITIDEALIWGLAFLARPLFGSLFGHTPAAAVSVGFDDSGIVTGLMASVSVVGALYPAIEGVTGRSPGKFVLGYTIAAEDGARAGIGRLLARSAVKNLGRIASVLALAAGTGFGVASFVNVVVAAGCLLALGEKRQALHDLLLRTAVFRTRDLGAAARATGWATLAATAPAAETSADVPTESSTGPVADTTSAGSSALRAVPPPTPTSLGEGRRTPTRPASDGTAGERKQCPKCGLSETERGSVIGWYCTVCGWRESRA